MAFVYHNRSGNKILFEKVDLDKFRVSGFSDFFMRSMRDPEGNMIGFDPDGGPFIRKGDIMSRFIIDADAEFYKICGIEYEKNYPPSLILNLEYTKPIDWEKVK